MVGIQTFLKNRHNKLFVVYTDLLNEIIGEASAEQKRLEAGYISGWTLSLLNQVVIPEMRELLHHARMGEVFFKYGRNQRILESTYFTVESCDNLHTTCLGKKLLELQELYSKL